jgi:hypothetical protein
MNAYRSPAPQASLFNVGGLTNTKNSVMNTATNAFNSATNSAKTVLSGPSTPFVVYAIIVLAVCVIIAAFWTQIRLGFQYFYERIRNLLGADDAPPQVTPPSEAVTAPPIPPQDDTVHMNSMVEKILPGRKEVFNISKNTYTYYDAEPLCKALGSELATYEQVKEAYGNGADWCNYGWTKGQMAVYPTQKETWENLQSGPEDQRGACGQPGLNGGFFDNPELRFGVNCYGQKPDQKNHDATAVASGEGAPLSPQALEFDKKVRKYRGEADHISVLPFNTQQWSS